MSCLPSLTRLNDLKRRFKELKNEADTSVSNIMSIVQRGKLIVASQQSLNDAETFLRRYPSAGSEFDLLISNLVKINCELEIVLCKPSEFGVDVNDWIGCDYNLHASSIEACSATTNTEDVHVNTLIKYNQGNICNIFDLEVGSILEMKCILGDHPLDFWLGYYSSEEYVSHMHIVSGSIKTGKYQRLKTPPAIGQFIIGSVYRGCVLSVVGERIVVLDIDTGEVKFTNLNEVWMMDEGILKFPPQAINCRLSQVPKDMDWCDELKHIFQKCMNNCNLVVSIIDIIPNIPPTFVVEIDAHDGTILDVNLNTWINSYVIPGLEKLETLNISETSLKSFYDELDPYSVYQVEECEYENGKSNLGSINSVSIVDCSVHSDDNQKNSNSNHCLQRMGNDMPLFTPYSQDHSICSSISPNDTNNTEIIDTTSPTNDEMTHSLVINELDPSYCVDDLMDSENFDITSLPLDENTKTLVKEFIPCSSTGEPFINQNFFNSMNIKSAVVCCNLEKGMCSDMFYVQGVDPWNFVLSHVSDDDMNQLNKEISDKAERGLLQHFPTLPQIGDFAIGVCNGLYFRARISNNLHGSQDDYLVVDIDSSEVKVINIHEIFILEEEFAVLPSRTLNCTLWNITRTPPYWNTELGECFQEFLQKNVLRVTIKDVFPVKDYWKHVVQVKVSSNVECDLSEWIMLFVIPKLNEITNLDNSKIDCLPIVEKLNPEYLFPKKKIESNDFKKNMDLNTLKRQIRNNEASCSLKTDDRNLVSLSHHSVPNSMSISRLSPNKCLNSNKTVECVTSLESSSERKINAKLDVDLTSSFDSLSLCSLTDFKSINDLKIGEKYYAFLSHIRHPNEFYVHVISDRNTIMDDLQTALHVFCSEEYITYKTKADVKQLISYCCAVNFEGHWCRARIIDWLDNSSSDVRVFLVDYGILATVPFYSVQYLKSEFFKLPVLALKCELAQISPPNNCAEWPDQTVQYFLNILDFNVVYCIVPTKFLDDGTASVFLSLKDNGNVESVNDYLVNEGLANSLTCDDADVSIENCHSIVYPPISTLDDLSSGDEMFYEDDWFSNEVFYFKENASSNYNLGNILPIVVTEIVSPTSFYAVINSQVKCWGKVCEPHDMLVELSNKIKKAVQIGQLRIVKNYIIGAIVVVCDSKDKVWYRARILSPVDDDDCVEVFFVDYGNTDVVKKDQVRETIKAFSTIPFQAVKFFINCISTILLDDKAKELVVSMLSPLLGKVGVKVEVVRIVNEEDVFVDIFCEGVNFGFQIAETLSQKGYIHESPGKGYIPG